MIHDISTLANGIRATQASGNPNINHAEDKLSTLMITTFESTEGGALQARRIQNSEHLSPSRRGSKRPISSAPRPPLLVRASSSKRRNIGCAAGCHCNCHTQYSSQSPPFLYRILGRLFVGYSGCPAGLVPPCNESSCRSGLGSSTQINYIFPPWFCNRLLTLTLETSVMGDPSLNLTVYRGVPTGSKIFRFTASQDVEGLCSLFVHGLASPQDVDSQYGYTALQVSQIQSISSSCKWRFPIDKHVSTPEKRPSMEANAY